MKKHLGRLLRALVKLLKLEWVFAGLTKHLDVFAKFLPQSVDYAHRTTRVVTRDGVLYKLDLDDYMQWYIFANCRDNAWKLALNRLREGGTVIDVGANVGGFGLKLAKHALKNRLMNFKVICFEPNRIIYDRLVQNLNLNKELFDKVEPVCAALGAEQKLEKLTIDEKNSGHSRIGRNDPATTGQEIPVMRLDDFLAKRENRRVDFIKIDVEGYEPFVMEGLINTVVKNRPSLYVEMTEEWFQSRGKSGQDIRDRLTNLGYRLYLEHENDYLDMATLNLEQSLPYQYNMLAVPS